MATLTEGTRVRLSGLVSSAALNGAEGVVVGRPDGDPPRYPVRLLRTPAAVEAHADVIRVKRQNLEPLPRGAGQGAASEAPPSGPTNPSGAAAAGGGGGDGSRHGPLDFKTRERVARAMVQRFLEALADDAYPDEAIEAAFGVRMNPQSGGGDLDTWPIGNLTFGAWITINNWYTEDKMAVYGPDEDEADPGSDSYHEAMMAALKRASKDLEDELVAALLGGCLPAWYEAQLRRLQGEGRASGYAVEIIRRGFRGVPWDVQVLARMAGLV
ncbi:hypothetical protein GPECTOR_4g551 [Gonium pectorale]|uniref:Uncharacterized protein n=1 Tax=Gonium pectorale TaxID=33097 RepID=A0A150GX53_GONPE|nr:hypothetical protein GPECTOR_4g551 [Gonium pectorale]|eukprot:KXZ54486.1 hypothetical protein GPECTOR_4g551 [Gonium pectorale]